MAQYDRASVKSGPYANFVPACLCSNEIPLELVAQTFANETVHYLLGCTACGKLGRGWLPHAKVSDANKATARPYRAR